MAGAVAVAVSAVAAGPAVAAKGGNSDNAHACQQGGHENRFEAETGNPFKNAGDCASHGAQGGATASLQLATGTYPCGAATCWGTLSGVRTGPASRRVLIATGEAPWGTSSPSVRRTRTGTWRRPQWTWFAGRAGDLSESSRSQRPGGRIFFDIDSPCG